MDCANNTESIHAITNTLMWRGYIRHISSTSGTGFVVRSDVYCSEDCYHEHRISQPIPQFVNGILVCETNYDSFGLEH